MIYIQAIGKTKIANLRSYEICYERYKPTYIVFIVTKDTINYIPESSKPNDIIIIDDENNIKEILEKLDQRLRDKNDDIIVNITTGTKAIISAMSIFAIKRKGKIIYVGGERENGMVITGTEKIYEYDTR